jgi:diaminopimelate epimerase
MDIKAFKMDGLGNDFVIIDQRSQDFNLNKDQIIKVCDRSFIGCDQLILIKKNKEIDADVEFYNSDGSASGACGNGSRCVAGLLSKESGKKEITLLTASGSLKSKILGSNLVETEIGIPKVNWEEIPLSKQLDTQDLKIEIVDKNNTKHIGGTAVNVGNPHIIFFVDDIEAFDLQSIGPKIESHPLFPEKCNVTLAKVNKSKSLGKRSWTYQGLWYCSLCNGCCS